MYAIIVIPVFKLLLKSVRYKCVCNFPIFLHVCLPGDLDLCTHGMQILGLVKNAPDKVSLPQELTVQRVRKAAPKYLFFRKRHTSCQESLFRFEFVNQYSHLRVRAGISNLCFMFPGQQGSMKVFVLSHSLQSRWASDSALISEP